MPGAKTPPPPEFRQNIPARRLNARHTGFTAPPGMSASVDKTAAQASSAAKRQLASKEYMSTLTKPVAIKPPAKLPSAKLTMAQRMKRSSAKPANAWGSATQVLKPASTSTKEARVPPGVTRPKPGHRVKMSWAAKMQRTEATLQKKKQAWIWNHNKRRSSQAPRLQLRNVKDTCEHCFTRVEEMDAHVCWFS